VAEGSDKHSPRGENRLERDDLDAPQRAGKAHLGRGIAAAAARVLEALEDIGAQTESAPRGELD
jgi:hypothetical protein